MRSKALVVAYAVHETGRREVIGIDIGEAESEAFWVERSAGIRGDVRGVTHFWREVGENEKGGWSIPIDAVPRVS